jgi:hypothetical protein
VTVSIFVAELKATLVLPENTRPVRSIVSPVAVKPDIGLVGAEPTLSPEARGGYYAVSRFNALRHGVLSQYTVPPWEDADEYRALLEALVAEHNPKGPTEEHLVEELAGIIWRKGRLRLGECAASSRPQT